MAIPEAEIGLNENRQVVLVLRLTLDQHSQVLYGELVNAEGTGQEHFKSLDSLGQTVERWLDRQKDLSVPRADRSG
jgi:hypothetical protein